MSEPQRPLPRADEFDTRNFGQVRRESLQISAVQQLWSNHVLPPSGLYGVHVFGLDWKEASGRATLYTYSVVRRVIIHSLGTWFLCCGVVDLERANLNQMLVGRGCEPS